MRATSSKSTPEPALAQRDAERRGRAAGWAARAGRPAAGRPPRRGRRAAPTASATVTVVFTGRRSPWRAVFRTRPAAGSGRIGLAASGRMEAVSSPSRPLRRAAPAGRPARPGAGDPAALGGRQGLRPHRWRRTAGKPQWVFYEGPPTANGRPGTHHIEARAFKDVFPRFKTMQGWHVPRRAGWDCHGLPVEIAVEQELGFAGKPDIERYGIAEFNARCRESVERHVDAFTELTRRMGYWVDMSTAYWTMDPAYIESVWWSLKQIFDKGLLVEDHRVAPYCPRCGTGLSDHEVAQGYETAHRPVGVRAAAGHQRRVGRQGRPADLDDDAVDAAVEHRRRRAPRRHLRRRPHRTPAPSSSPSRCWPRCSGEDAEVLARTTGPRLGVVHYQRPFELVEFPDDLPSRAHFVVLADYVTTEDGTGLVHQSPAFGADDLAVCRALRAAGGQPDRPDRALPARRAAGRRALLQGRRRRAGRGPEEPRRAVPGAALRAQLSALLALPHAADVLRAAVLVHPHQRRSRTSCSPRTRRPTGTRRTSSTAATATG